LKGAAAIPLPHSLHKESGGYGKEKTQKEVADLLGISQSYISRLEKRIIRKLRREIRKVE
jgi:DNA-directed RNA polymerase specialized sigma subunit